MLLTPRTTASPTKEKIAELLSKIPNGGGTPLSSAESESSDESDSSSSGPAFLAEYNRRITLNRQLVDDDQDKVEEVIADFLFEQFDAEAGIKRSDVVAEVIRGLDCIDMTDGTPVVVLEVKMTIEGAAFSPDLCSDLDLSELVSRFPEVAFSDNYVFLDVDLDNLFDLSMGYNFYLENMVEEGDFEALAEAALVALKAANPCKSFFTISIFKGQKYHKIFDWIIC